MSFNNLFIQEIKPSGKRRLTMLSWCFIGVTIAIVVMSMKSKPLEKKDSKNQVYVNEQELLKVVQKKLAKENEVVSIFIPPEASAEFAPIHQEEIVQKGPPILYEYTEDVPVKEVPFGSMIRCILVSRIVTNNFSSPVVAQIESDFYFNDQLLLPAGTRIFGEARKGIEGERVLVSFGRMVFQKDGQEVVFSGRGVNEDLSGGLQAVIVNKTNKKKIALRILNFLGGTLIGLQEKVTNSITGIDQIGTSSRNAVLEGVGTAFHEEAKRIEQEIDRLQGQGIVPEGTPFYIFLDERLGLGGDDV